MSGPAAGAQTIQEALAYWATLTPDAIALLSPGRESVTYRELHGAVDRVATVLGKRGLGRQDVIAVVFPEGLDLCLALLATMSVGIAFPLPWPIPELEAHRILSHPVVRTVLAAAETARAVRRSVGQNLPVITADAGPSGRFGDVELHGDDPRGRGPAELVGSGDLAVILRSSGTTGRPKLVPRTNQNIVSFCRDFVEARAMTPADRGVSLARTVYSLGHNSLMTTIFAGASLVVVPRLDRRALPGWWRSFRPTYLSTTPAVLRAIAAERGARQEPALRCVFSTSAPLLFEEAGRLESILGAPILNYYGMAEATGIAGERYPREPRVPGSVGSAWCHVQFIAESGEFIGDNEIGEIVVRGSRVFPGYLDDPEANAAAFLPGGWFRTGDLGFLDDAGYVHLRGRRGEIINRGGEKIDPGEVDAVLLACPAVAEAATFSVRDPLLGEDIVAAVVLAPNASATPRQLRSWMLDRLLSYKAPRRIWFVDDLPRTDTGKARRAVLREQFLAREDGRGSEPNRHGAAPFDG